MNHAQGSLPDSQPLVEYCDWRGTTPQVHAGQALLRGVKILGVRSQNGRVYLPEALARAVELYEGAKVNVNHPKGHPRAPRDYQDRIGSIRNVALRAGEGLFGDFHFNPRHALAEQLLWDAAHAPENVGFSHNVEAKLKRSDAGWVVEAITRVTSVDLVADPATTGGLFEAAAAEGAPSKPGATGCPPRRIGNLPASVPAGQAEGRNSPATLLEENESLRAETTRLRAEVDRLSAAAALAARRDAALKLLEEFGLPRPPADAVAGGITSHAFYETLLAADDEAAMRRLVEERAALVEGLRRSLAQPGDATAGRPVSREPRRAARDQPELDTNSFVRAIRY